MDYRDGIIIENIRDTITTGLLVYDNEGKKVGTISDLDRRAGYMKVDTGPFAGIEGPRPDQAFRRDLYIPFRLVTNIDPQELFLSPSRDLLKRDCANPPARTVKVEHVDGHEMAVTTEPSGYDGKPVVVERVRIDELRSHIAAGDHVYTSDGVDLGTIKQYDAFTGWMLVEKGMRSDKHDLMAPVATVAEVNDDKHEVHLVTSWADLQRMQHLESADAVFVQPESTG